MRPFLIRTIVALAGASAMAATESPLNPDEARQSFEVADDLSVKLVASEPLVSSPCAMAFDERGRLFVAENRGYPRGPGEGKPPEGTIALLEDNDGDGRMDKRTVFADGLDFPNGVMPWKGGLVVTSSPDLLYFRDRDGDGRADERRVLLTGFNTQQSTQLRVNGPLLGPDGWIWLASGLSGGKISNPEHPEFGPLDLKTDLRFDPESGRFESVDGRSQFGHSFDAFGRRFICMNRIQVQHVVLPAAALRRNPHLAFSDTVQNCPDLVANPLLRGGGGAARIFPISRNITTADSHEGTFSAACAVTIWPGGALPAAYTGKAFSCDPTGNLVHVDRLEPRGATFAAKPMHDRREFLASRDDWFRPVALATGPDGALYVCDMYRKVIEHPDYLPEEVRKHTDFEAGKDLGRIWRVSQKSPPAPPARFTEKETSQTLLPKLASRNGWERQTALRLLTERRSSLNPPELARAFHDASDPAQAAALLFLQLQLGELKGGPEIRALEHRDAGVRELALRFASATAKASEAAQDPSPRVRFAAALALGDLSETERVAPLAAIARRDAGDRWIRAAVLSSAAGVEEDVLMAILQTEDAPDSEFLHHLAQIVGKRVPDREREATLSGLLEAAGNSLHAAVAIAAGFADSPKGLPAMSSVPKLTEIVSEAATLAKGTGSSQSHCYAIELLGSANFELAGPALSAALDSADFAAQLAAVKALAHFAGGQGTQVLLDPGRWRGLPPAVRDAILTAVCSRPPLVPALLDALESESLPVSTIDSLRRQQLLRHGNQEIRARAAKLFETPATGDRQLAFESAKAALALAAKPANGQEVFRRACATCHRIERQGAAVGPDLFDVRNQSKESILLHIVMPEHEIAPGFASYTLELKDGRTLAGVVSSETPESITIRQPGGHEETLSRAAVSALTASAFSLMPPGLEKTMSQQELADLIAYLRGEK